MLWMINLLRRCALSVVWVCLAVSSTDAVTLQGRVTRSDSSRSVANATILIRGTNILVTSGADGRYLANNVPSGSYGLTCVATGLLPAHTGAVDLQLSSNSHDFSLDPAGIGMATVQGRARCAGAPCQGVLVAARQNQQYQGVGLSSADGSYVIEGLSEGTFDIIGVALGYLPTTIPSQILTAAGLTVDMDLPLAPAEGFSIRGVVGLSDNPLDRSGSTVRCNGQMPPLMITSNFGGSYTLSGAPAGLLAFTAQHPGYRPATHIDVLVGGDTNLDFVLAQGPDQENIPVYTFQGTVALGTAADGGTPPVAVTRINLWQSDGGFRQTTTADDQGAFSIERVPRGTYQAGAAREGYIAQSVDAFEMSGDRTVDFNLTVDSRYDWGPGASGPPSGCAQTAITSQGSIISLWLLGLLCLIRRGKRPHAPHP